MLGRLVLLAMFAACARASAAQGIDEEVLQVPVRVTDAYGKVTERPIAVTVFQQRERAPYPLLVLNHGRATDKTGRERVARVRFAEASRWLASLGWSVWVPTRIGYGVSGVEDDPEDSGDCNRKRYEPGYAAAADQVLQVVEFARRRADIDGARLVVLGQSFGGATSVAVAARNPGGLVGAINFAGGGGGNPATRPGEPCQPYLLEKMFAGYGKTARVPMLWVYTENDQFFKPAYTRAWFDAYRAEGGIGEFVLLPAFRDDGHMLFARGMDLWRPLVERFLSALPAR